MSYLVLARKWRPKDFTTLVGQEHVKRILTHALEQQQPHHAYLFTGTRGVGKTTTARIFAKCLNCITGCSATPCNSCTHCQALDAGNFIDLIEVDAASRTRVEDTRELLENVQYMPTQGRYKVYLIDEVHMLSGHSFNALLKTLEEPPAHVVFLLATTDPQKLPATVASRCLQLHLKCISNEQIAQQLNYILEQEKVPSEAAAIDLLAAAAQGSLRDALSLLDQAIAHGQGQVQKTFVSTMLGTIERQHIFNILTALAKQDAQKLLQQNQILVEQGSDFDQVLRDLLTLLQQIAAVQLLKDTTGYAADPETLALAQQFTPEDIQLYYQIALHSRRDLPYAPNPATGFEMTLLRMLAFTTDILHPHQQPAPLTNSIANPSASSVEQANTITEVDSSANQTTTESDTSSVTPSTQWEILLEQLQLSGLTAILAKHCILKEHNGDKLHLALEAKQAALLTDKQKQRLQDALSSYFKQTIQLTISIEQVKQETPADIEQRLATERLAKAAQALEQDPFIQAMQQTFDAKILPESIQAL
jgi:DNA polymerase-3 subunit gamma/tau